MRTVNSKMHVYSPTSDFTTYYKQRYTRKHGNYYCVIIMSSRVDNLVRFMIVGQMRISRITSKTCLNNVHQLPRKNTSRQSLQKREYITVIPNWRTAIPGAPIDFLRLTTSSVITPCNTVVKPMENVAKTKRKRTQL